MRKRATPIAPGLIKLTKSLQRYMCRKKPPYKSAWIRRIRNGKWCYVAYKRIRRANGVSLRIRFERNHRQPHFHIEYKTEYEASYRLPDCVKFAGEMPKAREAEMLEWANKNVPKLMAEWKLMHKS